MTTATLETQLEKLRAARATGAREIEFTAGTGQSRRVQYKSDAEMAAAIADLEQRIAAVSGPPVRVIRFATSKGLT